MNYDTDIKRADTYREIVLAAHRLFLAGGYHGTSMRSIALQAGITVSGIYNHFSSKEEIFREVLLSFHPYREILPALSEAQGETVEELIRDAANRMISKFGERLEFVNLMFIELVEFNGSHAPELFESIYPHVMQFGQRLLEKEGRLRDIPAPIMLRAFVGLFFSYIMMELLFHKQLPAELQENALEYFVDIYLHGILSAQDQGA